MCLDGTERSGVRYVVEAFAADGTFGRVLRVREEGAGVAEGAGGGRGGRRWGPGSGGSTASGGAPTIRAAKVMRARDSYIQYTSDARKEGQVLQDLEARQREAGCEVLTMRCVDSFSTRDTTGVEYWCLILEWLDASLFDVVRANRNLGLPTLTVRDLLQQMLSQLRFLQGMECTHTDIKHKNCCLVSSAHRWAGQSLVLKDPVVKLIDYGNAAFEHEAKTHPIHTKQFRAPEVLLNLRTAWGPPSDVWTLGVTAAFLVCGQLLFNSHDPPQLLRLMAEALGPFPPELLAEAKDAKARRAAETAAQAFKGAIPQLSVWLGLASCPNGSPEALLADLVEKMLRPNPAERINAEAALQHPLFQASIPSPEVPPGAELCYLKGGR